MRDAFDDLERDLRRVVRARRRRRARRALVVAVAAVLALAGVAASQIARRLTSSARSLSSRRRPRSTACSIEA